ncbi:hypothetical protein FOZ63_002658 [Perkinsus olseni]|uniref:RNA helicase n=1 Tax=Perkinsus olseni TaxID=32597 RepID=A0A7J6T8K5_PEROL|nr:hypothetical protein FOZ63_002658 [Perkinsus olseni]
MPHFTGLAEYSVGEGESSSTHMSSDRLDWSQPPPKEDGTWTRRGGRRPFHEDVREIFDESHAMTTGINFNEYDKIPVEVSGRGAAEIGHIDCFVEAGLDAAIVRNIERCGYTKPTPVQKHAIPVIMAKRDLMACAQTGSGKTGAFLLPTIHRMTEEGPPPSSVETVQNGGRWKAYPVALVLAPTRELASQIFAEARKFCFGTGIRAVVVYGGAEIRLQLRELERGCDLLVGTPGRLTDLIERYRVSLSQVNCLIFDEADRMLDMGFEPQIRRIVEQEDMPTSRQGRQSRYVEDTDKYKDLRRLLEDQSEEGLTLVFVETKRRADELEHILCRDRYPATSIHGDRTQAEREEALRDFKMGARPILVATDVAARGLDISHVNHVINYDLPHNIDDYVHRIGRTGRVGNLGTATSFVNESGRPILRDLWALLEENEQEVPSWFMSLMRDVTSSKGSRYGPGKGRGKGGPRSASFGSRDFRQHSSSSDFRRFEEVDNGRTRGLSSPRKGGGGMPVPHRTHRPVFHREACAFRNMIGSIRLRQWIVEKREEVDDVVLPEVAVELARAIRDLPHYEQLRGARRTLPLQLGVGGGNGLVDHLATELLASIPQLGELFDDGNPRLNHALVNDYERGCGGIMPHKDGPAYFPVVLIVCLGSATVMQFGKSFEEVTAQVLLPARSLLVFKGEAYHDYLHSIPFTDTPVEGKSAEGRDLGESMLADGILHRGERLSITLRRALVPFEQLAPTQ